NAPCAYPTASLPLSAAPEPQRSVARAAGGRREVIPTSVGGVGGAGHVAPRPGVGGVQAPWDRASVPKAPRPPPHRTTHWSRPPQAAAFPRAGVGPWGRRLTASVRRRGDKEGKETHNEHDQRTE